MMNSTPQEAAASPIGAVDPHWYAEGDPWTLLQDRWDAARSFYFETIFSLANGYMGFRGYREETDNKYPDCREGYLAGVFADLPPIARKLLVHNYEWPSRQMVSLPEIFSALIILEGEAFSLLDGDLSRYEQELDLRTGILERRIEWTSSSGKSTRLCFRRFLSAANPHLAVHTIEIEPLNWSGSFEICWDYDLSVKTVFRCGDPARAHLPCSSFEIIKTGADGVSIAGLVETVGSRHRVAMGSTVVSAAADSRVKSTASGSGLMSQMVTGTVEENRSCLIERYTVVATSRDSGIEDTGSFVEKTLSGVIQQGLEKTESGHRAVWAHRWKAADIEIDGSARDQALVRFSIFSLLQIAPFHADNLSIPARCYAFNRYNGHYFWDGEIFSLPFYQSCAPEVARNLLSFRCQTLQGARKNASLVEGEGAIFPWQGDADRGLEQAPWGLYEYLWHQNADIIYAFDQFARSTGNDDFLLNEGLEALAETARFWISKLQAGEDGNYHLYGTVGPDEAEEHGPDNGYTSLLAQRSLEISLKWWRRACDAGSASSAAVATRLNLSADELKQWEQVASGIHVPEVPDCPGVPLQDAFLLNRKPEDISNMTVADYWKRRNAVQVIKQADIVLAMYLLEDKFTREQIKRGYEFYEPLTLHVSSLSCNTHSIVAAIIGHHEEAYDYFHRAAGLDLDDLRGATSDGLHTASLGGVWQMTLNGFMGLRIRENHLFLQPSLPAAWKALKFPLNYRGWKLLFKVNATGYRIVVNGDGEAGATLKVGESVHSLDENGIIAGTYLEP